MAIVGDELVGGREVRVVELLERGRVVFGETTGIRFIPRIVFEIHSDLSHTIVVSLEPGADFAVLLKRVAFVQVGVPKPVPVV
jgi:hypothetical protein